MEARRFERDIFLVVIIRLMNTMPILSEYEKHVYRNNIDSHFDQNNYRLYIK